MAGEVRKAIGALDVVAEYLKQDDQAVPAEAAKKVSAALDALLVCIKAIEEDIILVNERLCELEAKNEQKPAGFTDKG
jgi:hypothetical protein